MCPGQVISDLTVLCQIQPRHLFAFADTQSDRQIDDLEDQISSGHGKQDGYSDTCKLIYNLRRILIEQKIQSIGNELKEMEDENEESGIRMEKLDTIIEYNNLKKLLFEKLNRVI